MTEPKPVAGYYRVSVARDDMKAPELYEEEIRRYCTYKNLELGPIYKDIDASGYRGSKPRPGFEALKLDHLDYSAVIVPKLARFGRSMKELVELFDLFDNDGVSLVFLDMNIDTSTSQGRLLRHIMAAFAEYESDVKADYARANHRLARAKGLPWGLPPFGYIPDRATRSYRIKEPEAEMVRAIFAAYADGASQYKTARQLNDADMTRPDGGEWTAKQVGRILDNPAYAALCVTDDGLVDGNWEAIIERELWDRVRDRRAADVRRRKLLRAAKGGPCLLSGLLYCGHCGKKLVHRSTRNAEGNGIYLCVEPGGKWCPGGSVQTARADAYVTERFLERCHFVIAGREADNYRDARSRWQRLSIQQQRSLLAMTIAKIVVVPWGGPRVPGRGRDLRINWKPGTESAEDVVVVARQPTPRRPRAISGGRWKTMRSFEVSEAERLREQRSARGKAYFAQWREVQERLCQKRGTRAK